MPDCTQIDELLEYSEFANHPQILIAFVQFGGYEHLRECPSCSTRYSISLLKQTKDKMSPEEFDQNKAQFLSGLTNTGLLVPELWEAAQL